MDGSFADVQYCIHADIVGGFKIVQQYADIIYEWSLAPLLPLRLSAIRNLHERQIGCETGRHFDESRGILSIPTPLSPDILGLYRC